MERLQALYNKRGYFERYGVDVVIATLLILITVGINSYSTYKSILSQVKSNWNANRCKPIYMPFAGVIMPEPGKSSMDTSSQNFQYCMQQDTSMIMNIVLMPFEFGMFIIIEFLDSVMASITAFMRLLQWLKNLLGNLFKGLYEKIVLLVIPLMVLIVKIRDALAKMNGVLVTALYSVMNIYNIMISGILNMMVVMNTILIITISILMALILLAFVFMPTPAFAVGFVLYASGMAILGSLVIPVIVIFTLMQVLTNSIFQTKSPSPPKTPSIKKKKRR